MATTHLEELLARVFIKGFIPDKIGRPVFSGHERVREPMMREYFSLPNADFLENAIKNGGITKNDVIWRSGALFSLLAAAQGEKRPTADVLAEEKLTHEGQAHWPHYKNSLLLPAANKTDWVEGPVPYFVRFGDDNLLLRAGFITDHDAGIAKTVESKEILATLATQREKLAAINEKLAPVRLARAAKDAFNDVYGLFATIHEQEHTDGLYLRVYETPQTLADVASQTFGSGRVEKRPNPNEDIKGFEAKEGFAYRYTITGDRRLELIPFQNPLSDEGRRRGRANTTPVWTMLLPQYAPEIAIPLVVAAYDSHTQEGAPTRRSSREWTTIKPMMLL